MISQEKIKRELSKLPNSPGVYLFKRGKEVLYVGKATVLSDRVKSYFRADIGEARGPLILKMLDEFETIDFIKTDSVLEALILEASLIKKLKPSANVAQKDDKSFNFVVITKENFPRVLVFRGRDLEKNTETTSIKIWGPFPHGTQLREAMKIVRKLFPYRDKCLPKNEQKNMAGKPCFNRQIGLCPGVCSGEMGEAEYKKQIHHIELFFDGKKKILIKSLKKEMALAAKKMEFEKANKIKKQIFALGHIQDVSLIKDEFKAFDVSDGDNIKKVFRIEAYDVAHISGTNVVGVMTVVEDGEVKTSDYRKFKIKDSKNNDLKSLAEILERRLLHIEWTLPDLIVVDGGNLQKNTAEKILQKNQLDIPVVSVVKDEHHRPKQILGETKIRTEHEASILKINAEAHRFAIKYHRQKRNLII